MTDYELKVRSEIEKWKSGKSGIIAKAFDVITLPISWTMENVIPDAVMNTVGKAIKGFLEILKDSANWTFSDKKILEEANTLGMDVKTITDLTNEDLENLDKLAQQHLTSNKVAAAIQGFGLGMGGLTLIAADIPLLFTISFRSIQQVGSCYGFNMQDPKMSMIVMNCLSVGSATSAVAKSAALADMAITVEALMKNWTYKKIAETTQTGAFVQALKALTKNLPKTIANNITKVKLGQMIPFVGAAVGGGFNYWFVSNVTTTSYMIFRELYLEKKHGDEVA
jgi:hypothetical protein